LIFHGVEPPWLLRVKKPAQQSVYAELTDALRNNNCLSEASFLFQRSEDVFSCNRQGGGATLSVFYTLYTLPDW